jgi:hypothetical protein
MPAFGHSIAYKGYTLRSRVEFAWAQHFEAEGLHWAYESKTFRDGKESYTPDFVLPGCYVEIKVWGSDIKNKFWLCPEPLLVCFGLPTRCYIRLKRAGEQRLVLGHHKTWNAAYTIARKVAA